METDWAENRAKIPQDWIRAIARQADRPGLLDGRARQVPHPPRAQRRDGRHRDLHQPPRHGARSTPTRQHGSTVWQPRPADPELEAEFLRRLMVRLGAQEEKAKQRMVAAPRATARPARAAVQARHRRFETLEVFEPFDRAWRRVGLALDRVGFTVEDRDRAEGPVLRALCRHRRARHAEEGREGRHPVASSRSGNPTTSRDEGRAVPGADPAVRGQDAWCRSSTRTARRRTRRPRAASSRCSSNS